MEQGRQPDAHREFEDMAVSHVLGGLPETQSRLFRAHLLDCPDCRARVGELRAIASDLADVERTERRQRAAKVLETKHRDDEDEDEESDNGGYSSRARLLFLGGVVALMLLAGWNFMLRGTVNNLRTALEQRLEATATIELGEVWTVAQSADEVTGSAYEYDGRLVLLLDGLGDGEQYGIYLLTGDNTVERRTAFSEDGKIMSPPLDRPAGVDSVLVVQPHGDEVTAEPLGRTLFEATAPAD